MVYPVIKHTLIPVLRLWIKKINGMENAPKNKNYIIASNHTSYMDHLLVSSVIISYLDKPVHYLAKKEHFETPFQRLWHRHVGAIAIDRQKGGHEALGVAIKCLKQGKIIGIYPEGTRSLTGKLQRAKTGIARLVLNSKAPVLPVGIIGTFEILPKGKIVPKLKRAVINIGRPMHFDKYYSQKNNPKVWRLITTRIMKEIAKLSRQKYDFL